MNISAFLQSPANRAGLSAWLATAITAGIQVAVTHNAPPLADVLGLVIGLVTIIQPDNAVTAAQLERAMKDLAAARLHPTPATIGAVINDGEGIVSAVTHTKGT